MTSVNSPACLLARNHFYKSSGSGPEASSAVFSCQNSSVKHKQKQVNFWVTVETPPGLPGVIGTKGLQVSVVLGFSFSPTFSTSKPTSPADQDAK